MTVKNPKNGLTFDDCFHKLAEHDFKDRVFVGNHTYVEWIDSDDIPHSSGFVAMTFHDTKVVNILDLDTVQLYDGGYKTHATAARMDWALLPLGFRMTLRRRKYQVYSISTGAYRDFTPGMILERGAF